MRLHTPPHPREIIKRLCLEPLGGSVTEAAQALDVSRKTLSAILNARAGVSPEMAVRLSMALARRMEVGSIIKHSTICGTLCRAGNGHVVCKLLAGSRRDYVSYSDPGAIHFA